MHAWSLGLAVAGGESILAGGVSPCLVAGPSQRRARRTGLGSKVSSVAPSDFGLFRRGSPAELGAHESQSVDLVELDLGLRGQNLGLGRRR